MLVMVIGLSAMILLLTGDLLLAIPVGGACLIVGLIGTGLAFQRSRRPADDSQKSIFR